MSSSEVSESSTSKLELFVGFVQELVSGGYQHPREARAICTNAFTEIIKSHEIDNATMTEVICYALSENYAVYNRKARPASEFRKRSWIARPVFDSKLARAELAEFVHDYKRYLHPSRSRRAA